MHMNRAAWCGGSAPHKFLSTSLLELTGQGIAPHRVIALWLGHESIETTHVYLEADLTTKEQALQKLTPVGKKLPRFKATDEVLAFLTTL